MRNYVLWHSWERLDWQDIYASERYGVEGDQVLGRLVAERFRLADNYSTAPSSTNGRVPFTFARGCVVLPGSVSVDTTTGDVRLSGDWRFAFTHDGNDSSLVEVTGLNLTVANGWQSGSQVVILLKPLWQDGANANRVFVDPNTGQRSTQAVNTRKELGGIDAVAVAVPVDANSNPLWWDSAITDYEDQGYSWAVITLGDAVGRHLICPVWPPISEDGNYSTVHHLTAGQQAVNALVYQMRHVLRGDPGADLRNLVDWVLPPADNIQALHSRAVHCAARIIATDTGYNYDLVYNVSQITSGGTGVWTVTPASGDLGRLVHLNLVRLDGTASLPGAPYSLTALVVSGGTTFQVEFRTWDSATGQWVAQALQPNTAIDIIMTAY